MIITCKPHGTNLTGASENINEPQKTLDIYQTLLPLWGGGVSGDETTLPRPHTGNESRVGEKGVVWFTRLAPPTFSM